MTGTSPATLERQVRRGVGVLVAALTLLAFSNAAPRRFVLDDALTVPPNIDRGLRVLPALFSEPAWGAANTAVSTYRPLLIASFVVEGSLWTDRPMGMHRTNIALHIAATLLLFGLLEALRARSGGPSSGGPSHAWLPVASGVAALAFGVHPIHTEVVDSVFNRSEMMATIGVLGALWTLVRSIDTAPVRAWGLAGVLYFLALLCRENAVTLPGLAVIVLGALCLDGSARERMRRLAPVALLVVPLGLYGILRHHALSIARGGLGRGSAAGADLSPGWWSVAEQVLVTFRESVRMIVWPVPLRCSYWDLPVDNVGVALLVFLGLVACAWATYRRAPAIAAGVAFFYLALAPSTRLVGAPGSVELAAERYLYLPSAGLAIPLMSGLVAIGRRGHRTTLAVTGMVLAGILAVLGTMTWRRNIDWRSQEALWRADVSVAPRNGDAWMQLTTELLQQGRAGEVAALCGEWLAQNPDHAQFHNNCATAAMRISRYGDAETYYRRAIALGAGSVGRANLARMLARLGRLPEAQAEFQAAVDNEPNPVMQHVRRGEMLLVIPPEQVAEARAEFRAALAIDPDFTPARDWLRRIGDQP